ncbi:P-II family nitrogen regulator [Azotosporobacter soli]|uniref:P-II family nitrogen regulator n=1 Tax=Azotosporobacter soli TaxID=3055040 RepID=UPI0031FE762F
MKEIMAIVRMNKTNATKKALVEAGATGFTATKVLGRGKLVKDKSLIADRKIELMSMVDAEDVKEAEKLIDGFLDGARLYSRRLFNVVANDEDVPRIVEALMQANRTENKVGDGKIFIMPICDVARVRTGEIGKEAL